MNHADKLGLVGSTVAEKYAVECVVGEGGFAVVYRARHLIWKSPVALKVFTAWTDAPDESTRLLHDGFLREGALLADLSTRTPAIVQARDVGVLTTEAGVRAPYLVLEWLEGATLEQVLVRETTGGLRARGIEEAVRLLDPIGVALGLAHAAGIVHQDVKASNILVMGDARGEPVVKLVDFGVAKVMSDVVASTVADFPQVEQADDAPLRSMTPAYAAPEQFAPNLGSTGPWTDVFALALLLVEVVSGKDALEGCEFETLAKSATDPQRRPTPRTRGVEVSDAVESVFEKAVAVNPEHRWQNASEFWSALSIAAGARPTLVSMSQRGYVAADSGRSSLPATAGTVPPASTPAASRATEGGAAVASLAVAIAAGVLALGVAWYARGTANAKAEGPVAPAAMMAVVVDAPVASTAPLATSAALLAACPDGMVPIPGGSFFMGSDEGVAVEKPSHAVSLAPFCMDKFEVTVADYLECSAVGRCKRAGSVNDWDGITSKDHATFDALCNGREPEERGNHPVNCVDWSMADRFCREGGKRLPTEAEWEFAARGPDGRKYPWGDSEPTAEDLNACGTECAAWGSKNHVDEKAMYASDDGFATTAPVGSFPKGASRYGVEDMVGNVWEWVADWYAPYTEADEKNPQGPAAGEERIIRGGSWNGSYASWVRPTFRYKTDPNERSYGIGFRCAK